MKKGLTFERLKRANKKRCEKFFHKLDDWSEMEWAACIAGEVGELANYLKKRKRYITSHSHKNAEDKEKAMKELLVAAKKEIGDIQCYLDLMASALGTSIEECVIPKFNEVSKRVGSKIKL